MSNLLDLQESIGYRFRDSSILVTALTHQSYANEHMVDSYERLEFLGDAVIEMVVSKFIYDNLSLTSGELTKLRASLVSTVYLSNISNKLRLNEYVLKSKSLSSLSKKNIADLFESLIGAVFIDGGIDCAQSVVEKFVIINIDNVKDILINNSDYKTKLQELCQSKNQNFSYELIDSFGLDHDKNFVVVLRIEGKVVAKATAKSIRDAETVCAQMYLKNN